MDKAREVRWLCLFVVVFLGTTRRRMPRLGSSEVVQGGGDVRRMMQQLAPGSSPRRRTNGSSLCELAVARLSSLSGCGAGVVVVTTKKTKALAPNRKNACGVATTELATFAAATTPPKTTANATTTTKVVTVGYLYCRNAEIFEVHLRDWERWPGDVLAKIYFVVVDDGSPPGERAVETLVPRNPNVTLAIATIACDVGWNIHGARNLLFHAAPTDFVLMMDADTAIPSTFASSLFDMVAAAAKEEEASRHSVEEGGGRRHVIYRRFQRVQRTCNLSNSPERLPSDSPLDVDHPAAMLLSKATYWHVGGCDEDFVGAYGSTHFRFRADATPGVVSIFPTDIPRLIAHTCHDTRRPPTASKTTIEAKLRAGSTHVSNADVANADLFKAKKHGDIPWSSDYLRFDWFLHSSQIPSVQQTTTSH